MIYGKERAIGLWEEGTERLMAGDVDQAIDLFTESLEAHPTAEAHTFRGWAYSFEGRYDEAIDECLEAIEIDPDFGNPYNDIGSYLVALGRGEEADDWFAQAKEARRYESRHFPYLNLGRLWVARGRFDLASLEFEEALAITPEDPVAQAFLKRFPSTVN